MAFESLTDEKFNDLLNCPKRVSNPQTRIKLKDGHEVSIRQTTYSLLR